MLNFERRRARGWLEVSLMTAESRQRILDQASTLFFAGTFHSVGITELCKAAGVHKGTLYHFFPSKTELLVTVLEDYTNKVVADYERVTRAGAPPAQQLWDFFQTAKRNSAAFARENGFCPGCFIGNVSTELSTQDPEIRCKVQEAMTRLTDVFEGTIADLKAAEGAKGDSRAAATVFMGLLQGAQVMAKLHNDVEVFDLFGATAIDTVRSVLHGSPVAS
jgi:TetR/AcrR family transcriptional repressor of nem operon